MFADAKKNMGVFKEYDIRGTYPEEINESEALKLGKAIGAFISENEIFLGYDNRLGSIAIKPKVAEGLQHTGKKVIDIGMVPVQVLAFATFKEHAPGVCITASHNPAKYTGLLIYKDGITVMPKEIEQIYENSSIPIGEGSISNEDYTGAYLEYITKGLDHINLKVGVDTMGGVTHTIAKQALEKIGVEVTMLRAKPDPNFYNMTPEPSKDNTKELAELVKSKRLDFGVQFDGDGDRVAFVDENGNFVDAMSAAMMFIKYLGLKKAVATVACSKKLEKFAEVKYIKIGRPHVEKLMSEGNFDIGIETSLHFYFGRYFPFSDGLLGALLMAKIVHDNGHMSELVKSVPKAYFGEFSLPFANDALRDSKLEEVKKKAEAYGRLDLTDGVKLITSTGFVLVRKSNTEPLLRVYYEGEDEKEMKEMQQLAKLITGS